MNRNDTRAKLILDKWIPWAMGQTRLNADGTFQVPSTLAWSGQPSTNWTASNQNWNAGDTTFNANLRVTVSYHRFWAQVDIALANAEYGRLFP
jgi:Glycosyl hydrolase family 48